MSKHNNSLVLAGRCCTPGARGVTLVRGHPGGPTLLRDAETAAHLLHRVNNLAPELREDPEYAFFLEDLWKGVKKIAKPLIGGIPVVGPIATSVIDLIEGGGEPGAGEVPSEHQPYVREIERLHSSLQACKDKQERLIKDRQRIRDERDAIRREKNALMGGGMTARGAVGLVNDPYAAQVVGIPALNTIPMQPTGLRTGSSVLSQLVPNQQVQASLQRFAKALFFDLTPDLHCDDCAYDSDDMRFSGLRDWRGDINPGVLFKSGKIRAEVTKGLDGAVNGVVRLDKLPFEIRINAKQSKARALVALAHELVHVMQKLYKLKMSHDQVHTAGVFLATEALPALNALQKQTG